MPLLRPVFKRDRIASESRFKRLGESSVDALRRVEAECDWSDAGRLFTDFPPEPPQQTEPAAYAG